MGQVVRAVRWRVRRDSPSRGCTEVERQVRWGILGSVSNVTGRVERRPIAEDVWMPDEIDVYYEYRVLFSNSRRGGTTRWSDFTSIGE